MNEQIVNQPFLYVNQLGIARASATTLTIEKGQSRNSTNNYDIVVETDLTLNALRNGVNGLDTGSFAIGSWYAVYVLGDTSNHNKGACIMSLSGSVPVLPEGYDVFKRIGWVATAGTLDFIPFTQYGTSHERHYFWTSAQTTLPAGNSTTYAAVDLSGAVPATAELVLLNWELTPATAGNFAKLRATGSTSDLNMTVNGSVAAIPNSGQLIINTDASQSIDYQVGNGSDALKLSLLGFIDYI